MSSTEPYPEVTVDEFGDWAAAEQPSGGVAEEDPHADGNRARSPNDRQRRPLLLGRPARQLRAAAVEGVSKAADPQTDRMPLEAEPGLYSHEDQKTPDPIEGADLDRPVDTQGQAIAHRDERLHDIDDVRANRIIAPFITGRFPTSLRRPWSTSPTGCGFR